MPHSRAHETFASSQEKDQKDQAVLHRDARHELGKEQFIDAHTEESHKAQEMCPDVACLVVNIEQRVPAISR